ncbi:type-F conjugative transfer system secretin TraK [Serratia sp. CY70267]|uniref:type-F conjugative transfer system secretin TraK n=1 Tax=Serratia TaxID=613 RepID=UPI00221E9341|nr:type-F conjugative transfer system secretin TraK [Serratia marcescens]UYU06665.1 type-F conjugative transfer system secretin TraK [Serratia marcescens]
MKTNNPVHGWLIACALTAAGTAQAGTVLAPVTIPLQNGSQAAVALSNSEPNLFNVPGDSVLAVSGVDENLVRYEPTANGGLVLSTLNKKPFTFVIETERGMNFSIRAVPRAGSGRTFQLVSGDGGVSEPARIWEQSQPYESMLVDLNRSLMEGRLPVGYGQVPVTTEQLAAPYGLRAEAAQVWKGHNLKVVRFTVSNPGTSPRWVNEHDFWTAGVRAVMFDTPTRQIVAGGRAGVWITFSGEAADGQH